MLSELPAKPRLADGTELVTGPGEFLQLRGCTPPLRLTGRMPHRLLPLLDGTRTLEAITAALHEWPADHVLGAIRMLKDRGLVGGGDEAEAPPDERSQAAFYWAAGNGAADSGEQAVKALRSARIHLFGWGRLVQELGRALGHCGAEGLAVEAWLPPPGVRAETAGGEDFPTPEQFQQRFPLRIVSDLVLLALPRPAPALMEAANTACINTGVPWLPVVISGGEAVIGPAVLPGRSACYTCYKQRLKTHAAFPDDDAAYDAHLDRPVSGVTLPEWPPFTTNVASLAAMEAVRLVTQFRPPVTAGHALCVDGRSGSQRVSRVWKLPRCPECMRARGGEWGGGPDGRPGGG